MLKLELLDSVDLGAGGAALQGVHRLWTLQPHLEPAPIERLDALTESLTLDGGDT